MNISKENLISTYTKEQKEKIFEIKKYTFLKRKRKEIVEHYHKSHPWTNEEDEQLKELLYSFTSLSWKLISSKLKERSPSQCMHHWNMNLNPGIKKGKWSKEEDELVLSYVKENGANWGELQLYLQGRTTKQIRERWVNYLSKDTSDFKWNRQRDKLLIEQYVLLGSSWVKISAKMPHTTENMVKNRFYSLLRGCVAKCKKNNRGVSEKIRKIKEELNKNYNKSVKQEESKLKLSDFSLENWNGNENEKNDLIDKVINNPYLSKKKNYSLKILIEFLPFLIEELSIDLESLNNTSHDAIKDNDEDINENREEEDEEEEEEEDEKHIDMFNSNDNKEEDTIDFYNTNNNTNAFNDTLEMNIDIDSNTNTSNRNNKPTSTISKQLNSITKVLGHHHDQQFKHLFFESFRDKALFTSSSFK